MELFTMGIGHYSQRDVTEAARAFTGWTIDFESYSFVDDAEVHDDGEKTILGHTGNFRAEDVIAILAARPETAERVTRKLAAFFLGDEPRHALARRLADVYFATDGNIRDIVREILLSDDFTEARGRRAQVVTPTEYMVAAIRALDLDVTGEGLFDYAYLAGQALYLPPNVAGWNGGLQWINTGSYLARMNFANDLTSGRAEDEPLFALDAAAFFARVEVRTADDLIDFAASCLGMPLPDGAMRDALRTYLASADSWNGDSAERWGRGTLHLLLASPQFQLQ
jgi:uncharacterized protein (DUF1800 family)